MRLCVDVVSPSGEHMGGPVSAVVHDLEKSTVDTFVNKIRQHLLIPFTEFAVLGPEKKRLDTSLPSFREVLEAAGVSADAAQRDAEPLALTLQLEATEATLAKQLQTLFDRRTDGAVVSLEELGLMYCYQHGVSLGQALKIVSSCTKRSFTSVADFLKSCTPLTLQGGKLQAPTKNAGRDSVPAEREAGETPPWVKTNVAPARAPPPGLTRGVAPLSLAARPTTSPVLGPDTSSWRSRVAAPVTAAEESGVVGDESEQEVRLQELHKRVASRAFSSRVAQTLTQLEASLQEAVKDGRRTTSLKSITRGGAAGKGTLISTTTDATVLLLFTNEADCKSSHWQAPCKRVLESLSTLMGGVTCTEGALTLQLQPGIHLTVRAAMACEDYSASLLRLRNAREADEPNAAAVDEATLALLPDQTAFISKQPGRVKVTIRLVKWWRDQQRWSSPKNSPSDKLLELVCISVHRASKPATQQEALEGIMALLSTFSSANITWSNFYDPAAAISQQLRDETPLVMDPADPFCNVASPAAFDCTQMMELAASRSAKLC